MEAVHLDLRGVEPVRCVSDLERLVYVRSHIFLIGYSGYPEEYRNLTRERRCVDKLRFQGGKLRP